LANPGEDALIIPIRFPFLTCQNAIADKAKTLAVNVGAATSGYISDSNFGTVHMTFQSGAIYCKTPSTGAFAVYGEIWLKWKAQANYGYPLIDESTAGVYQGQTVRYNTFSNGGGIYWTASHGAFLIYGDIYQTWKNAGGVSSTVGFPITDETSSGTNGGRYNDFINGMIFWHAGTSWIHTGALPTTITINWQSGGFNMGDVTGNSVVTLSSNGNARMQTSVHVSDPWVYSWAVGW
jgi:uncharacterized protein with LGFP repeats